MRLVLSILLAAVIAAGQEFSSPPAQAQGVSQNGTSSGNSASNTGLTTAGTGQSQPATSAPDETPASAPSTTSLPSANSQTPANHPVLKVTTRLVLVDVVVTDGSGRPVTDLKQSDFEVRENGKSQNIVA